MSITNNQHKFLIGGGEMGEQIRNKDWSTTTLGEQDNWPQSLRTTLNIILNANFPMFLCWGSELTFFYNDAYRLRLRNNGKLPSILGQSADIALQENWSVLSPVINQILTGKVTTDNENQNTFLLKNSNLAEVMWTYSYSPVYDEYNTIAGVLALCSESTENNLEFKKLEESEERYKTMADHIPNLAWMSKADGTAFWFNKKWYSYTGTTEEEMKGWGWQSVYKDVQLPKVLKAWKNSVETGSTFEMIYPIKAADGSYREFLTRALAVKNDQGEIVNWFGTCTDITDQKLIEAELLENKNQLEFVIDAAQLGIFDYDPISDKFSANLRLKNWFGLLLNDEVELSALTNAIIDQDRLRVLNAIQNALQYDSGGNYDIVYNIINPISQQEITLHAKGKAWFNGDKIAYRLNGTVEDITAQTIARKKIELSETNLRLMILQAPVAIAIMRGNNYITEIVNKIALKFWARSEEEVINLPLFQAMPELLSQGIKDLLDGVMETGIRFATSELPVQINRSGVLETVYFNFSFEPLFDEKENVEGIMAMGYDVTDQIIARNEIKKSEENFRSLVESAPFPIGVFTGKEMRITLANQAIINTWGKGTEVLGKLFSAILPELENQNIYKQLDTVFTTGIAYHAINQGVEIVKEGRLKKYYYNYSFTPLFDSAGKVYGVMNTAAEVTELHEAIIKREESDKRFRDAVQQAPIAIVVLRGKDNIVETANTPYLELVDKTEAEFLGKPLFESLPDVEQAIDPIIKDIYKTENAFYGYEFPVTLVRYGKKEIVYFNFVYHPLKEDNEVTGIMVVATDVTTTVLAKRELEEKEQKLNIVINASELGIWEFELGTDVTIISDRALEILGFKNQKNLSREQLVSNIHPHDKRIREFAFQKAIKTGILHYVVRTVVEDKIYWVEAKGMVYYDSENQPIKMLGTLRDISEEKNFQEQLLEREQKFRLLADSMPQMIWTANPEGHLNYFNEAVFKYAGLTQEELDEKGWIDIVHDEDREENTLKWIESITTEKDFLIEHRFRRNDGTYRWQLSRAIPQRDQAGKITMWVGTSTDIQEQKIFAYELEKQVKQRTKELSLINESLEKSEERYHLMVEEIQDYAILYLNKLGIIENWNLGAQKIKGYSADEIVGKYFSVFYTSLDQENQLPEKLLAIAEKKGKAKQEGWRVRKDGSLFWASVVITAIHNKRNDLIGFSKFTHDLTDKKEAEDKLKLNAVEMQHKNIELEKMNKELQSFAYISSHDLQEPLRKIQTFVSQIMEKEEQNLTEIGKDKFRRMNNAAHRMQALINDLLAYSKTNIQEVKFEKTNISLIIKEVKEDLVDELEIKGAQITYNIIGDNLFIAIIPFQFRQLLYNLISNSLKFSKPDIQPVIEIRCEVIKGNKIVNKFLNVEKDYCHICVSDNGIGFEQEYSGKIFEVFQRLHGKEIYDGTGIGLAIVKKIVENHKGIITTKGMLNVGACFDIYIPIQNSN